MTLVLQLEMAVGETGVARQAIVTVERGVSLPAADERGFGKGWQERLVPPDTGVRATRRDTHAEVGRCQLALGGDHDVEQPAAGGALGECFGAGEASFTRHAANDDPVQHLCIGHAWVCRIRQGRFHRARHP